MSRFNSDLPLQFALRLTVGHLTLDQAIKVQILEGEPKQKSALVVQLERTAVYEIADPGSSPGRGTIFLPDGILTEI